MTRLRERSILGIIVLAAALRLLPHPWNVTPIGAMAVFGGAMLGARPTVAVIEWIDPLMASGNWVPELVAMAGGVNLFGEAGKHSPWMTWDELQEMDPEVIFIVPCGFDLRRTREEVPSLTRMPGWANLRAVRTRRIYLADGNQYFNRPGPRLVELLEILAEVLHPAVFQFGHEGKALQQL